MIRTLTFTVTEEEAGISLLEWLRKKGCSRQVLAHLKNTKGLFRNGERPLLHSASLVFVHPVTGEQMKLTAELPEDIRDFADWKKPDLIL